MLDAVALTKVRNQARSGQARAIRLRAGLSLDEIGRVVGRSAPCVSRWEMGLRKPRGEAALRYGALLDALVEQLEGAA